MTNAEMEIMETLWESEASLTGKEIVRNCTFRPSYVHICLKALLEKELIRVDGFKRTGKNYARAFRAAISREEYWIHHLYQGRGVNQGNDQQVSGRR